MKIWNSGYPKFGKEFTTNWKKPYGLSSGWWLSCVLKDCSQKLAFAMTRMCGYLWMRYLKCRRSNAITIATLGGFELYWCGEWWFAHCNGKFASRVGTSLVTAAFGLEDMIIPTISCHQERLCEMVRSMGFEPNNCFSKKFAGIESHNLRSNATC